MDVSARLEVVEAENDALRERLLQLESLLVSTASPFPLEWGLTGAEERVLAFLVNRELASKEQILTALYALRVTDGEVPEVKIVDVFVCKIRKKLPPGSAILTLWGRGYSADAGLRARFANKHERSAA